MKTSPVYKESKSESKEKSSSLKKEGDSVNIRKIENGYIATSSGTDGKGNYRTCETYHKENPLGED